MLSLKDLSYLVALDELGHFGKAAQACYVSQPTLSGQLKKLQNQLGVELIEKGSKKVILTHVGREIAQRAKAMVLQAHELEAFARASNKPLTGRLKLAIIPSLAPYLMAKTGACVNALLPGLTIELHELETHELLRQLKSGEIDIGILVLPQPQAGLRHLSLWQEPLWLGVGHEHPWAKKTQVTRGQLAGAELILLKEGHCLADQAQQMCQLKSQSQAFRGASLETLRYMVSAGNGATIVPQLSMDAWISHGEQNITYIPITSPKQAREIGFLARSGSAYWPCVEALHGAMAKVLPKNSADTQTVPLVI
ncbi:LysR substrate-binding domain-containing protein [Oceanospirillaceae bacterium]|jgi:LysR family hydrogen peroxide-inducible transcriptional activator|uniref:LysR substrate-binding domain-containing protein n=1 Tax=Candidatus Njordibacter sp. Uisw_002 TaxID=3230971 RepID=UPI0023399971|nr:LysR substrate-binding domain-containing protein [Oceanospirillaceae bacterium]MDC1341731.1 LysR substrate-binding domain-containing protein [Oceanospirillaceae bacterium]MDC1341746.1 LysR substrate-binding domain-containing protein [Oceanospirillaceae bacterium]|tara:strand:+ start:4522 stop:5448 length:927 start_codon:yes stop_codon:yes gene_type:complete